MKPGTSRKKNNFAKTTPKLGIKCNFISPRCNVIYSYQLQCLHSKCGFTVIFGELCLAIAKQLLSHNCPTMNITASIGKQNNKPLNGNISNLNFLYMIIIIISLFKWDYVTSKI